MKKHTSCALVALIFGALTSPALAQDAAEEADTSSGAKSSPSVEAGDLAATTAQTGADGGEIVVTGSRIARRDYTSSSPISTVSSDFLAKSESATLESSLNQLPQIASSASSNTNTTARGGQASLNLRGLGQQRTLVLLDGRRIQPSSPDGAVDLNIVPSALVGNIEIITGGASAVYGSDAVTGVVNLKLRRDVSGVELSGKYGMSELGDAQTLDLNLVAGGKFADGRGSALLSLGYSDRKPAEFAQRDHLRNQVIVSSFTDTVLLVDAANLPSQAVVNSIFAGYGAAPGTVSRSTQLALNADGTLFSPRGPLNYRGPTDLPLTVYNGSLGFAVSEFYRAQTPLTRHSVFGHVDYELTEDMSLFAEALYTNYETVTGGLYANSGSSSGKPLSAPVTNPFIRPDLAAYLASRSNPNAPFRVQRFTDEAGPRAERNEYDVYQITVGINGKIAGTDLKWGIFGSSGKTSTHTTYTGFPSSDAINQLLNAPDGGASLCAGGYDIFGPGAISADCARFIQRTARAETVLKQKIVEANLAGTLLQLPAGPLQFAAGASYRQNDYSYEPDHLISSGELANFLPVFGSRGTTKAKEVYGELLIPVLKDIPFIRELTLNPSYRYSHYDGIGGVSTYKIDGDWTIVEAVRVRGGYSRATRAPSAGELFAASSLGQASVGSPGTIGSGDPCDSRGAYRTGANAAQIETLCLAQGVPAGLYSTFTNINPRTPFQAGGNLNLRPEEADTYSVGLVLKSPFTSPWLGNLTVSLDYYSIKINEAIGQITNQVALAQCFDTTINPDLSNSNYFCQLLNRNPANGQLDLISNPLVNLGSYSSSGIDGQVDWRLNLADAGIAGNGSLAISTIVSWLDKFEIQNLPTAPVLDYAGTIGNTQIDLFATAHPKWKATTSATLAFPGLAGSVRWRYIGPMENAANVGTGGTAPGVAAVSYFDFDLRFDVAEAFTFNLGVVNAFDRKPPVLYRNVTGTLATEPYTYDLIGRRFYMGAKIKF